MEIKITPPKKELAAIMHEFKYTLGKSRVCKLTASSINDTLKRGIPTIKKHIKKTFAMQKFIYNEKTHEGFKAYIAPRASANALVGGITISSTPVPMEYFKHKQKGGDIAIEIYRGKQVLVRSAFVATMANQTKHVFSRGFYAGGTFKHYSAQELRAGGAGRTGSGKRRVTKRVSISSHAMARSPQVSTAVSDFINGRMSVRLRGMLQAAVARLSKKR